MDRREKQVSGPDQGKGAGGLTFSLQCPAGSTELSGRSIVKLIGCSWLNHSRSPAKLAPRRHRPGKGYGCKNPLAYSHSRDCRQNTKPIPIEPKISYKWGIAPCIKDGMTSMSETDQLFTRIALNSEDGISSISEPEDVESSDVDLSNQNPVEPKAAVPRPRAIGAPLPMGVSRRAPLSEEGNGGRLTEAPPLGRALAGAAPAPADEPSSSLQRIISSLRSALPFVQRLLPLLDGNIAATVSNLLAPHPHGVRASAQGGPGAT